MGLFDKLFKKDSENVTSTKAILTEFEKDLANYNVFPVLKPLDWTGIDNGALIYPLKNSNQETKLVLGFGFDTPENFKFILKQDLVGQDVKAIINKSFANLNSLSIDFEISETLNGKVITLSGNDFAAEKILSKEQMSKAHTLLGSNELFVSIPRRRCMMITSKYVQADIRSLFLRLHENAWADDSFGNAPIFNGLVVVANGEIVDYIG